jgi:putative ABC transport system ATP-binding protein
MPSLLGAAGLVNGPLGPIDVGVRSGECVVVQGRSGSGKTLLLRALADLDPSGGIVSLEGTPRDEFTAPEWRRRVGYVPAEPGWWSEDVADHFSDLAAAGPLIERLELTGGAIDRPVSQLSTGERQRLALIRALVLHPLVLLLDEPTAALDPERTLAVEAVVSERMAAGVGVIWVSHDPEQTRRMASRVLALGAGTGATGVRR